MKFFKNKWLLCSALLLIVLLVISACDGATPSDLTGTTAGTVPTETVSTETVPSEQITTEPATSQTEAPTDAGTDTADESISEAPTEIPTETATEMPTEVPIEVPTDVPTAPETETETEPETSAPEAEIPALSMPALDLTSIPAHQSLPYYVVNDNIPFFTESQYTTTSYEYYSPLDTLGRCGITVANVGVDLMPTEDRGSISSVKPTGWHSVSYDSIGVDSLYNRSHLIAFQLCGENANEQNLITGTRYMNQLGMVPFENMVADYVKETGNHVLYRVTPIFDGDNLVAAGVLMEAWSVEDNGDGVCFNVYLYNVQPGVEIDYATGDSRLAETEEDTSAEGEMMDYILNIRSKKFHHVYCASVSTMSDKNKQEYHGTREDLIEDGYTPCGNCRP